MNVLIVFDEKSIRASTAVAIKAAGHQADSADNGAVALLKLEEKAYALVLLDLRLGNEDGLELLERIKRQSPQVAVVAFTAYASTTSAVAAIQRGAFDYIEKPFTPERLRQLLAKCSELRT
jgi:two-component system, NtrC family, response regulator AlgB